MRILFVFPALGTDDAYGFQVGMGSLMATAIAAGHEVDYRPLYSEGDVEGLAQHARRTHPDAVGIHLTFSQLPALPAIARAAKAAGDTLVLCGGPHATLAPTDALKVPEVDLVVRGEADLLLPRVLAEGVRCVAPGVVARGADPSTRGVAEPPRDLDALPAPHRPPDVYAEVLAHNRGWARFVFARGCSYRCSYCSNHALRKLYGEPYVRFRSPAAALAEIDRTASAFDVKWVHLDDDVLTLRREWLPEFLTGYASGIRLPFSCNLRANRVTRELFHALRSAGCRSVTMGVETGDEELARSVLRRHVTNRQIERAFDWAHEAGLRTVSLNMVGLPEETPARFEKTIELNRRIRPTHAVIYVFSPYPGTEAYRLCEQRGWLRGSSLGHAGERKESPLAMPQFPPDQITTARARFQQIFRSAQRGPGRFLRIGFVTPEFPPFFGGGVGSYVFHMARALAARGHDVHVFTRHFGEDDRAADPVGLTVHRLPVPEGPSLRTLGWPDNHAAVNHWLRMGTALCARLLEEHRRDPFDLVEFPEWTAAGLPALLSPEWTGRSVVNFHTPTRILSVANDLDPLPGEELEFLVAMLADACCAPSETPMAQWVKEHLPLAEPVTVVRHPTACGEIARTYRAPDGNRILFVGRIEPRKGVLELAAALPTVLARFPEARVRLVGRDTIWSPLGTSMRDCVRDRLPDWARPRVEMVENTPSEDLYEEYRRARLCVFPSRFENFPNVCLEAMAAGRTAVVPRGTGMAEMMGDTGVVYDPDDPGALAAALIELFGDPARCARLGRAAFARVRREFAPERVAAEREAFYRRVIDAHPEPSLQRRIARVPPEGWRLVAPALANLTLAAFSPAALRTRPMSGLDRLMNVMREKRAVGWRRVALYGAGAHTRSIFERRRPDAFPLCVAAVIDDARTGDLCGIPIVPPGEVERLGVDGVVLSSDSVEDVLWKRAEPLRRRGIPVLRLYGTQ